MQHKIAQFSLFFCAVFFTSVSVFAGSETKLFVPKQYAPLSSFQEKTSAAPETLVFTVNPAIIQFVVNNNYSGWIAYQNSAGTITLLNPSSYDATQGTVRLLTQNPGKYVVVAEPFTNDLPIVTHWKQSLNAGRGGFTVGAADPIGTLDYDPFYNGVGETSDIFDSDAGNPYVFNTKKYALFSSDPTLPEAKLPGYERYVGENYTIDKISDRLAAYLSLKTLETTGFPLLHRNHPWAFYGQAPAEKQVRKNIPAFQAVHAVVIDAEADKPALATFILPPLWTNAPSTPYPVLFNGLYDIHQNFVWGNGLDFIKTIADLRANGIGSSMGILWNGGGAYASQTMQPSSYLNVAYLFFLAQTTAAADPQKIVAVGISRGGHTALNVAANPIFHNYKVSYALAYSPPTLMGEHAVKWISSNYAGDFVNLSWATGYKYSWRSSFIDPITKLSGPQLFLNNVAGSPDPNYADLISPLGDWLLNSLKAKGTSVYLSAGTNDAFIPFDHEVRLYNRMKQLGISVGMDVGYRFGHNFFTDKNAQAYWAMKEMMTGTKTPYAGLRHFRRVSETGAGFSQAVQFTPQNSLTAELPKQVYRGQKIRVAAAGSAGLTYAVMYYKIDDAAWNSSQQLTVTSPAQFLLFGSFSGTDPLQSQSIDYTFPASLAPGKYLYLMATSKDQGKTWELTDPAKVPQNVAVRFPLFEVVGTEPNIPALDMAGQLLNNDGRSWGLSTD